MIPGPETWDCEVDEHEWYYIGTASDGTSFYRCKKCGKEEEG